MQVQVCLNPGDHHSSNPAEQMLLTAIFTTNVTSTPSFLYHCRAWASAKGTQEHEHGQETKTSSETSAD